MPPPGWSAFDPNAVAALRDARHAPDAPCPLRGHAHRIPWAPGGYAKGTELHGEPAASFRVSPTYVLADPMDNFIVGHELIGQLSGKAETWRLGNENSEDALSFNVFPSLQDAGMLRETAQRLVGDELSAYDEPQLIVWGHRLDQTSAWPVPELQLALNALEGTAGQQTEPDVILRIPGWRWVFIGAKLASPTSTYRGREGRLGAWIDKYGAAKIFSRAALTSAEASTFPEQLLRNVAVAHAVAPNERTAVIALVREVDLPKVSAWSGEFIADSEIITGSASWEQLYALTDNHEHVTVLRQYLADKSVNLRPAFAL